MTQTADDQTADDHSAGRHSAARPEAHLAAVDARLVDRYPDIPEDEVRRVRREESARLAGSPVTAFTAILVERAARQRLADRT
ncbi:hypothetical protein AB0I60_07900 [Actinosynnema sp. NPDC050436]|uniref:three-helix bundle dimerization domain-containing protein n=1 Tax=Actinosynnema sp. NPDC050436 TaxID=3155659 RepID=UPI003409C435